MGDIFFDPISISQAPRRIIVLLGHVRRAPAPAAGTLSAWKRAAARHMAKSLGPEAPGYLDMLADAAVHPPHPQLTELTLAFSPTAWSSAFSKAEIEIDR